MATTQYIGARYVPILANPVEWSNAKTYEPLTIVTHEGNSYTSRQFVPVGIDIANGDYWALTGNYNAQIELYRRETAQAVETARELTNDAVSQVDIWLQEAQEKYAAKSFAFDTVADMQAAYALLYEGAFCHTSGFHESGDGGAAWYIVSSTGVANGMDVLACGNLFANLVITEAFVTPEMFGAYGNDANNDTDALQKAIDSGKTVELCNGKTYLGFSLTCSAGCVIHGNNATIKRPNLSLPPYNYTVAQMKWVRTLVISADMTLKDVNFDNNCFAMWKRSDGYSQEQSAAIAVGNATDKFTAFIDGCTFSNSAGDGILITNNAKLFITNIETTECFRGGITIVGNSEVNVDGWVSNSITLPDGIDIEVDSATQNTTPLIVNLANVIIDNDLDLGIPANGKVNIDNLIMRPFDQDSTAGFTFNVTGSLNITNSTLRSGRSENIQTRLVGSGNISISNCHIIGNSVNSVFALITYQSNGDLALRIKDCVIECYNCISVPIVDGSVIFDGCDITCENSFMVKAGNLDPQIKYLNLSNSKIKFADRLLNASKSQYATFSEGVNIYLSNLTLFGNENSDFYLSGSPNIYFSNLLMEAACKLTLGGGATPKFYGMNRVIVVPSASSLTYRGWVAGNDIAIARDTGARYQYQSGTTWNAI